MNRVVHQMNRVVLPCNSPVFSGFTGARVKWIAFHAVCIQFTARNIQARYNNQQI